MRTRANTAIAEYDNPKLYSASSGLRQQKDAAWVMGQLPDRQFRACLDLGCGNGDFLSHLVASGTVSERAVGIDRSDSMAASAREKVALVARGLDWNCRQGDILDPPEIPGTFDLVTMLAVQHWLYPRERDAYRWIAAHLEDGGIFCMTTYHPAVNGIHVGGSDVVVLEAMERIGEPGGFPGEFLPIGKRTRPVAELRPMLERYFRIVSTGEREAVTVAADAEQYTKFHIATFGSYYAQLLPKASRSRFFQAIGGAAMERMQELGYVTTMTVQCWISQRRPEAAERRKVVFLSPEAFGGRDRRKSRPLIRRGAAF